MHYPLKRGVAGCLFLGLARNVSVRLQCARQNLPLRSMKCLSRSRLASRRAQTRYEWRFGRVANAAGRKATLRCQSRTQKCCSQSVLLRCRATQRLTSIGSPRGIEKVRLVPRFAATTPLVLTNVQRRAGDAHIVAARSAAWRGDIRPVVRTSIGYLTIEVILLQTHHSSWIGNKGRPGSVFKLEAQHTLQ